MQNILSSHIINLEIEEKEKGTPVMPVASKPRYFVMGKR